MKLWILTTHAERIPGPAKDFMEECEHWPAKHWKGFRKLGEALEHVRKIFPDDAFEIHVCNVYGRFAHDVDFTVVRLEDGIAVASLEWTVPYSTVQKKRDAAAD